MPLLRPEEADTYHIYSYIVDEHLVTWLHQSARESAKCNLIMCSGIRVDEYWWLLVVSLTACNSGGLKFQFLCVSFSHSSFLQARHRTHSPLSLPRRDSSKVTSSYCIQLKSYNSWVMFSSFTQVQMWLRWIRVDQIIITLIQKREEWETHQSLIHSPDGSQLRRVSKTSALQGRKFLDWVLFLLSGRDFLSIDLCGPLLCSTEGPFCLFFLAISKMGFKNIFYLEALSILQLFVGLWVVLRLKISYGSSIVSFIDFFFLTTGFA